MATQGFWDEPEAAQAVVAKLKVARAVVEPIDEVATALAEVGMLVELAEEEGAAELVEDELAAAIATAEKRVKGLEFQVMLGGENDGNNAYLSLQAGAGGVDAADFASMLLRMYVRWAERRRFGAELIEVLEGEEDGIRHATVHVKGPYAYGYLKAERGVHRLVRISPYDAANRRHTAFAAVEVMPELEDDAPIEIKDDDLRVDTYRAGGAGGQHVNKTDSAVRLTHLPTGLVVQCQNERSQHKNKTTAMRMLKSRLYELRQREKDDELKKLYGAKGEIAWGSQIRSYVLHPYQMVKDHRTSHETGNTQAVFDGDLDDFITEYLRSRSAADADC